MRRFVPVLVALCVGAGLVGCGGSGINTDGTSDPAITAIVDDIVGDPSFDGTRADAECFVNYVLDETSLTVEQLGSEDDSYFDELEWEQRGSLKSILEISF